MSHDDETTGLVAFLDAHGALVRDIFAHHPAAVLVTGMDGRIHVWGGDAERIFGYSSSEALGQPVTLVHSPSAGRQKDMVMDVIAREGRYRGYVECVRKDGEPRTVELTASYIHDSSGEAIGVIGINVDVTERLRLQEELVTKSFFLETIEEVGNIGFWSVDTSNLESFFSAKTKDIYGWSPDHEPDLAQGIACYPGQARDSITEAFNDAMTHGVGYDLELPFVDVRGNSKWIRTIARAEQQEGKVTRVLGTLQDITDVQRLRSEMQRIQKLDALGRLAGGIAHDFNNLLTAIACAAEEAVFAHRRGESPRRSVDAVLATVDRAARLTNQLLILGRGNLGRPVLLNASAATHELVATLKRMIHASVTLRVAAEAVPPRIRIDALHFEQILMNLVLNAAQAMPDGGVVEVAIRHEPEERERPMCADGCVAISVMDAGSGMEPELIERIFDPFFTTKGVGGTGLGLSIVDSLTRQYNGWVTVDSKPGEGTTLTVRFPAVEPVADADDPVSTSAPRYSGSERVLLVEDDDAIREAAVKALGRFGYRVTGAPNPVEALASHGDCSAFDCVVTDAVMPRMDGRTFVRELRARGHRGPILIVSGFDPARHGFGPPGDERGSATTPVDDGLGPTDFLAKPFKPRDLAAKVRSLLDASS